MKNIYLFIITLLIAFSTSAQPAGNDVVLKINGDEMKGKVTELLDSAIKFVYTGETLVYTIKKQDILKITYASGRVEIFNKPALPSQQQQQPAQQALDQAGTDVPYSTEDHHNRIAILPFSFFRDNESAGDDMGVKAQGDAYTYLAAHSAGYTLLDSRTTNALLFKAGVTHDKIAGFTMQELCNILGVEYIVDGTVTQNKGVATSYGSGSATTTDKYNSKSNTNKTSTYGSAYSTSSQTYITTVSINVYNDKNTSIYNQSHRALFASTDLSYSSPLEYLLKRCPVYRK